MTNKIQSHIKLVINYMIACSLALILVLLCSLIGDQYNSYLKTKQNQELSPIIEQDETKKC